MANTNQLNSYLDRMLNNDEEVKATPEPTQTVTEPATKKNPVGRPKKHTSNYERTSFIVNKEYMDKIRVISFKENLKMMDIIEEALKDIVARYETKNGVIEVARSKENKTIKELF